MIINIYNKDRQLYFVRCLDTDRKMFIGSFEDCKQFQVGYNEGINFYNGIF